MTTVVAGPGFGKSTVLGQAMRLHDADPRGMEAWVCCEPGDEDAHRLADAICRALGSQPGSAGPLADVLAALQATSPVDTCLILDDVHELPAGSGGAALLGDVLRRLPAHVHLVLAARMLPAVPLARLRAADLVLTLGEADLAFTPAEAAALARRAGRPAVTVAALAGWPALVRLTLAAPAGVARAFLWEEVGHRLSDPDRALLLALALLGTADGDTLAALCPAATDPDTFACRVPLVDLTAAGGLRIHPLWLDALSRLLPAEAVREASARVGALLLARGEVLRAGSVACAAGDADLLEQAALALVRSTLATFPPDTGARWLASAPPDRRRRPRLLLLDAAARQARDARDPEVDRILTEAVAAAHAGGDTEAEAVGSTSRPSPRTPAPITFGFCSCTRPRPGCPARTGSRRWRQLGAVVTASLAELHGDLDGALAALRGLDAADAPVTATEATDRLHAHLLLLAGEADEAAALAEATLAGSPHMHVRRMPPFACWLAGRPESLLKRHGVDRRRPGHERAIPVQPRRVRGGDRRLARRSGAAGRGLGGAGPDPARRRHPGLRDAGGRRRGPARRRARRAGSGSRHRGAPGDPSADRPGQQHSSAPLPRDRLPALAGRAGGPGTPSRSAAPTSGSGRPPGSSPPPARAGSARTTSSHRPTWPSPRSRCRGRWSGRAGAGRRPPGRPPVRRAVGRPCRRRGARGTRLVGRAAARAGRAGARQLLAAVPQPPCSVTRIEVLGPLRLLVDGTEVHRPELRRCRVRELLGVLTLRQSVTRDELMDLLWPEPGPDGAAGNLRVTLSYLRRALEPDRPRGTPSYHLRVEGDTIGLTRSARLRFDLDDLREHLAAAPAGPDAGDPDTRLAAAVGLWRGDPLAAVARLPAFAPEVAEVGMLLADAALLLGERRLAEGDTSQALGLAERVLAADPVAERGLRLLLAARLHRAEPVAVAAAVRRIEAVLADLGVAPDPATAMLVRQARIRLAPGSRPALGGGPPATGVSRAAPAPSAGAGAGRHGPPNRNTAGTNSTRQTSEIDSQACQLVAATIRGTASTTTTAMVRLRKPKMPQAVPCNRGSASSASSE